MTEMAIADDQKALNERADKLMVLRFSRLQFLEIIDLQAEYKKHFFVPCSEYLTRDDPIWFISKTALGVENSQRNRSILRL